MKTHSRLLAVAAMIGWAWSSLGPIAAADPPPAKAVIAVVGAAHIHAPSYVERIHADNNVRVKYVWDPDARRAEACLKWLGGDARIVADAGEVFSDPEVTGVLICSETNRHHDLVIAAAKAKKAMFVEKPLGITAKEAAEMAGAVDKAGVFFTTGYGMRTQPKILFLKEQIAKGNFGRITRVLSQNCHDGAFHRIFNNPFVRWMADVKQAGVGGFGDLGTHSLDLLLWLAGDVESVTGDTSVVARNYGETDDCGEAMLKFKNGATGVIVATWVNPSNPIQVEIAGTKGHAMIVGGRLYFQSQNVPGSDLDRPVPDDQLPPGLISPVDMFLKAARGEKVSSMITAKEAAARVSVMEAIYDGAKKHEWVKPQ
jgi:predicted dehydrogenase